MIETQTIVVALPPAPNADANGAPDQAFLTPTKTVSYDAEGRITGMVENALAYVRQRQIAGERLVIGEGHWNTHYVDLSGTTPEIRERPAFASTFDPPSVAIRVEAILAGVPAGEIAFTGPVSGGGHHEGGDLHVGFTVPGIYQIAIDPFPSRAITLQLTVTS